MHAITVISKRDERHYPKERIVYVGRPSALGNPFPMTNKADDRERADVIAKYALWFRQQLDADNPEVLAEIDRIHTMLQDGPVYLMCWCAPKACHADVLKTYLTPIGAIE